MNSKLTLGIAVVVVLIAGWFIYKHNDTDSMDMPVDQGAETVVGGTDNDTIPAGTTTLGTTASTTATTGTVKEFTVNGGNFYFAPKTMTVNKGDTVKINFVNAGGTHDLKIDEFNVATPRIQSGQTATVTFVADKTGSFEYYCSVGTHRQMGMVGTLTVK